MSKHYIKALLCATTALGLGVMAPGVAQAQADAPPARAADEYGASSGDIVVTAQRREELQRDVPISITALNAETLSRAGVTNTLDLGKITPGVILPLYGAYVQPSVRGISSSGVGLGDSSNVAIYIDGVYQANNSSGLADLPDVQSVQILKGPQGSLYGQNATGGAIIIDTVAPGFTWKGKASIGYGNFDDKTASGYVSGPLTSTVAMALSAGYRDRRGLSRDLLRGGHDDGLRAHQFRGKLLWEPSDGVSLTLAAYYTKRGDTGIYSNAPLNGNSLGNFFLSLPTCGFIYPNCASLPRPSRPREFAMNPAPDSTIETWGGSLRGKFLIGDLGTLNTVTAYNKAKVRNFSDVEATPVNIATFDIHVREKDFIQELNFSSNSFGGFTISAGAFFLDKVERYAPQINDIYSFTGAGLFTTAWPTPLTPIFTDARHAKQHKRSYAGYVELNYDLTDQLTLTASGRYSYEKVNVFNTVLPATFKLGDPLLDPLADPRGHFTFEKFTPRAVLRYKPDEYNTFYASYSQGFKSGYVNMSNVNACTPSPACIDPPVEPEVVDAFEVGYKGKLAPGLDLNLSAFHYLYKNIQVFIFDPGPPPKSTYQNAASGKINGAELELSYRPTRELTFTLGGAYLDAKYQSFPAAEVFIPTGAGNMRAARDVSGNRLMRTPEWTANGSINYIQNTSAGEIGMYVGANYNSGVFYDPLNRVHQDGYALVDAELSFSPAAVPGVRIALWGKNLTDHDYLQSVLESPLADNGSFADPRTYGVRLEFRF